jgi:hypothetical protein
MPAGHSTAGGLAGKGSGIDTGFRAKPKRIERKSPAIRLAAGAFRQGMERAGYRIRNRGCVFPIHLQATIVLRNQNFCICAEKSEFCIRISRQAVLWIGSPCAPTIFSGEVPCIFLGRLCPI